ncbi:unnamed protein product [Effrenium voratum]|nr:unnamed protein product [Effrenium voratum]
MVSWVAMKVTDTAVLGHVGTTTRYLDASALSDLRPLGRNGMVGRPPPACSSNPESYPPSVAKPMALGTRCSWLQEVADASYFSVVLAICLPVRIGVSAQKKP